MGRCQQCHAPTTDEVYTCCEKGSESLCERCCFDYEDTTATCAECKDVFCEDHGDLEKHSCCGNYFCGFEDDDKCRSKHKISKRKECGHLTCNYQEKERKCTVCKAEADIELIKGDIELVKDLKEKCKSSSLKKHLDVWLKKTGGTKRKTKTSNSASKKKKM